jgi:hypothetical protein
MGNCVSLRARLVLLVGNTGSKLAGYPGMTVEDVRRLVALGESNSLEYKAPTGQLGRGMETRRVFLNTRGGVVVIGVTPDRRLTERFEMTWRTYGGFA